MKIVFMGTPDFAVSCLEKIYNSHHEIVGVVTGPDKKIGRGQKILPTAIKRFAKDKQLFVLTPIKLRDKHFIQQLKQLDADLFVVVAFKILPEEIFTIPEKGTINLHGSLLPKFRGAAPINWAIINGETETGVTTFFIEKKVDTGEIILKHNITISPDETAGELHDRMCIIGADVLLETINLIENDRVKRYKQIGKPSVAPKITKELCGIDWSKDTISVKNLIRGLSPYPGAFSYYMNKKYKVCCIQIENKQFDAKSVPGQILGIDPKGKIFIATGDGVVSILELQPESKRKMTTAEYLNGHNMKIGEILK